MKNMKENITLAAILVIAAICLSFAIQHFLHVNLDSVKIHKLNQQINRETSQSTHQRFSKNLQAWHDYHEVYTNVREQWDVIPYQEAIKRFYGYPDYVIGDFGCGEAFLAQELSNKIYSFDYVAVNDKVTACDMSKIPLPDETLDVAVFSLALMGINFIDYLKEAYRCLKFDGHLWIAEPTSRIKDVTQFKKMLENLGFDIRDNITQKGKFTFIEALKSRRTPI